MKDILNWRKKDNEKIITMIMSAVLISSIGLNVSAHSISYHHELADLMNKYGITAEEMQAMDLRTQEQLLQAYHNYPDEERYF